MSEPIEVPQAQFEGWAIVELMGHRREIGYVVTQAFGPNVLFRVDTPELPEREFTLTTPEYANDTFNIAGGYADKWCPAGSRVKRRGTPARSCLIAPAALYAINPCSEKVARTAIEKNIERPLILLELATAPALPAPRNEQDDEQENDEQENDKQEPQF